MNVLDVCNGEGTRIKGIRSHRSFKECVEGIGLGGDDDGIAR